MSGEYHTHNVAQCAHANAQDSIYRPSIRDSRLCFRCTAVVSTCKYQLHLSAANAVLPMHMPLAVHFNINNNQWRQTTTTTTTAKMRSKIYVFISIPHNVSNTDDNMNLMHCSGFRVSANLSLCQAKTQNVYIYRMRMWNSYPFS